MGTHIVQRGETLSDIARRAAVSLPSLLRANPTIRHSDIIRTGQVIQIPLAAHAPPPGPRLDERFLTGRGLLFPRRSQAPSFFAPGEANLRLRLPAWQGPSYTLDDITRMLDRPHALTRHVDLSLYGGPGSQVAYDDLRSLMRLDEVRKPDEVRKQGLEAEAEIRLSASVERGAVEGVSVEVPVSLVYRGSAAKFKLLGSPSELLKDPKFEINLGLGLPRSAWGSSVTYLAAQVSLDLVTLHILGTTVNRPDAPWSLDFMVGQVGVGVEEGKFSGQLGVGAAFRLPWDLTLNASLALTVMQVDKTLHWKCSPFTFNVTHPIPLP